MAAPEVTVDDFESFAGFTLSSTEQDRITILLDRARRKVLRTVDEDSIDFSDADIAADYTDAVSELAWFYLEAEKAGQMEILAMPVDQLTVGTLFWTKENPGRQPRLDSLDAFVAAYGQAGRRRVVLRGELGYPD